MSKAIKAGDIPHDIQRDLVLQAVLAVATAAIQVADGDAKYAARAVAEAGVAAWRVLNELIQMSPSPSVRDVSRTLP